MNSIKITIFFLLLNLTSICFSQAYSIVLDTTNVSNSKVKAHIIIDDFPEDSLKYEITLLNFNSLDSTVVFKDTFDFHRPNVNAYDYINFRYQVDKVFLTIKEFDDLPFRVKIDVLSKLNISIEQLIFNDYE